MEAHRHQFVDIILDDRLIDCAQAAMQRFDESSATIASLETQVIIVANLATAAVLRSPYSCGRSSILLSRVPRCVAFRIDADALFERLLHSARRC
jgi:hypothetical protein